jgi:polyribonucleotide nucleotidyltransferase
LVKAYSLQLKQERVAALNAAKASVASLTEQGFTTLEVSGAFKSVEKDIVRGQNFGIKVYGLMAVTPKPFAKSPLRSAFCPACTDRHCLPVAKHRRWWWPPWARVMMSRLIHALEGSHRESFMLHYNFPPYSVGETGRMSWPAAVVKLVMASWPGVRFARCCPARLTIPIPFAWCRKLPNPMVPARWPRSGGSSLALMDAGVPLAKPVAGIAMGLIKEDKKFAVLTDILGDEDHLGDMDFKVAGTQDGITALQMDIKITSITQEIMKIALEQAKEGADAYSGRNGQGADHRTRRNPCQRPENSE